MDLKDIAMAEVLPEDTRTLVKLVKQLAKEVVLLRSVVNKLVVTKAYEKYREND